ncbi:Alcohol dehydrogenase [Sulfitobacter indolifex]|uniref:Oxidoreductase, putative n=1 Tax=Sulfitobacter indolifex HEL-45 TaxID=391624 RepID=A0ABM9XBW5_9RHOB|nr:NADPH:quinone oxidoreductase family protein [Sulfitobacter indolifex]EDQ06858.1 oxidoreductase, putative [Sulfitobacter indolifex HEL-45]UOA17841.1 Alcohol dehydrogenase [Sulfitobacter indolifex]
MRAMQVTAYDEPLTLRELEMPMPGQGEVLIQVDTCGLNFGDLLIIKGTYQEKPPLPFTLGMEMAGTITALGEGVDHLKVGQRVAAYTGFDGLAEYAAIPAAVCVPIPEEMTAVDAAAFLIAYGTSHVALDYKARLQPGERLLVLGASGGIGLTAVELGKMMGAEVIAVARGADKLAVCKEAGADHLINSETDDIRAIVKELGGADVVYDPVGGDQFKAAMRACNPEARLIPLGFASGEVPQIPANILLVKNLSVLGFYWGGYAKIKPSVLTDSFAKLIEWYVAGKLKPHVSNVLPLEQANEALALLRDRKATGKVVVQVAG